MTPSQAKALLRLEPEVSYDLNIMHGLVRESLWQLRLIEKVKEDRRPDGPLKIRLTMLGCDVRQLLKTAGGY